MARMKTRKVAQPIFAKIEEIRLLRNIASAIRRHYGEASNAATDPKDAGWWGEKGKGWFDLDAEGEALRAAVIAAHTKAEAASRVSREAYTQHSRLEQTARNTLHRRSNIQDMTTVLRNFVYGNSVDVVWNAAYATNQSGEVMTAERVRAAGDATKAALLRTLQETIDQNCVALASPEGLAYLEAARAARDAKAEMERLREEYHNALTEARDAAKALTEHAAAPRTRLADEAEAALMQAYMLTPSKLADLFKAREAGALEAI